MAFADTEKSVASAAPVELYRLTGDYNTYYLTTESSDVTNTEATWSSVSLEREAAKQGTQEDTISLDLTLPMDHPMVQEYALQTAPPSLELEFLRAHRGNLDDTLLIWTGFVLSFSIEGRQAKLTVPSVFNYLLDSPSPPQYYQGPCNRKLYDDYCGLDETKFSQACAISTVNGRTITVDSFQAFATDAAIGGTMSHDGTDYTVTDNTTTRFYASSITSSPVAGDIVEITNGGVTLRAVVASADGTSITVESETNITSDSAVGGELQVGNERRKIISHSGTTFVISSEFSSAVDGGDSAVIYQGCDRSGTTCRVKFDNWLNFFGFPFVPDGNPFVRRLDTKLGNE